MLEEIEELTRSKSPTPLGIWKRYVIDVFSIIKNKAVTTFHDVLNSIDSNVCRGGGRDGRRGRGGRGERDVRGGRDVRGSGNRLYRVPHFLICLTSFFSIANSSASFLNDLV